jgi:hypothetical protein
MPALVQLAAVILFVNNILARNTAVDLSLDHHHTQLQAVLLI